MASAVVLFEFPGPNGTVSGWEWVDQAAALQQRVERIQEAFEAGSGQSLKKNTGFVVRPEGFLKGGLSPRKLTWKLKMMGFE